MCVFKLNKTHNTHKNMYTQFKQYNNKNIHKKKVTEKYIDDTVSSSSNTA